MKLVLLLCIALGAVLIPSASSKSKRATVLRYSNPLLPPKVVLYQFDSVLANSQVRLCVQKAMEHVSNQSCVQFQAKSSKPVDKQGFLLFRQNPKPGECSSQLGLKTRGATIVHLGAHCGIELSVCMRELLHALGLGYEAARKDRRDHVRGNRKPEAQNELNLLTPYDLSSATHHVEGHQAKDAILEHSIGMTLRGSRHPLSHRDKVAINYLFRCAAPCDTNLKCAHGGFVNSKCKCVCPFAFSGKICEKLKYERMFNLPNCGRIPAKTSGYLTSPNYPKRYPNGVFCQWLIEAPKPWQKLQFKLQKLDLEYEEMMATDRCQDKLKIWPHGTEVATNFLSCLPEDVNRYEAQTTKTQQPWLLIEFRSYTWGQFNHSGFNISYSLVDDRPLKDRAKKSEKTEKKTVSDFKSSLVNKTLQCFNCRNGECNGTAEEMTTEDCDPMEACALKINAQNQIEWRGCMTADRCIQVEHEKCQQDSTSCTQCCAQDLCNSSSKHSVTLHLLTSLVLALLVLRVIF